MNLEPTQLSWIIERLEAIHNDSKPWNVRAKLSVFTDLLKSRVKPELPTPPDSK